MSGIAVLINLDGRDVDREILRELCRPMEVRAPDRTGILHRGQAGLGHVLLSVAQGDRGVDQPYTADGEAWVTSDANLCGRDDLRHRLRLAGVNVSSEAADPELLLAAYRAFGESFARHLVGDFAVAIWDERDRKLLCARDHLGVRPLFYARVNDQLVLASRLDAILAHPDVNRELDEEYIADFLLFGSPINPGATAYKHIKRLLPAHILTAGSGGLKLQRYWSPRSEREIRYPNDAEYSEHFYELFEKAVIERMPASAVAIELTGGMDSSSIAAVASAHARDNGKMLSAYLSSCGLLTEDQDPPYARLVASHLGIPLHELTLDDYRIFERYDSADLRTAEPNGNPDLAQHHDKLKRLIESGSRVLLTGQMGDTLFAGSRTYFPNLLTKLRWGRLIGELSAHKKKTGSLTGTGLGAMVKEPVRRFLGKRPFQPDYPTWLNPEFASRLRVEDRWRTIWKMWSELNDIEGQLQRPWFSHLFEDYELLNLPMIVRHPFSDVRLVEFSLGLPNYMSMDKRILREAMGGRLPGEVTGRPKGGPVGNHCLARMKAGHCAPAPSLQSVKSYVDTTKHASSYKQFIEAKGHESIWFSWLVNYPIALAYWMTNNSSLIEVNYER